MTAHITEASVVAWAWAWARKRPPFSWTADRLHVTVVTISLDCGGPGLPRSSLAAPGGRWASAGL